MKFNFNTYSSKPCFDDDNDIIILIKQKIYNLFSYQAIVMDIFLNFTQQRLTGIITTKTTTTIHQRQFTSIKSAKLNPPNQNRKPKCFAVAVNSFFKTVLLTKNIYRKQQQHQNLLSMS